MEFVFNVVDATGAAVTSIVVSADDLQDARRSNDYRPSITDLEVAVDIYEQRYESALAAVGITYDEAVERGFYLKGN